MSFIAVLGFGKAFGIVQQMFRKRPSKGGWRNSVMTYQLSLIVSLLESGDSEILISPFGY